MIKTLNFNSLFLIGYISRRGNRVVWIQLYESFSEKKKENELRVLMIEISQHIIKCRETGELEEKFNDGKLIYQEVISKTSSSSRIYCMYLPDTKNTDEIKSAFNAIIQRGGVYSAERFHNEMIDILDDPIKLKQFEKITVEDALNRIDSFDIATMGINELGYLISLVDRSSLLNSETLEKIYFQVYESLSILNSQVGQENFDPDEFLDACYTVAQRYHDSDKFHLALELYKKIIPFAEQNTRIDLEIACKIKISTIYKNYFSENGNFIIDELSSIDSRKLDFVTQREREKYYSLLGYAHDSNNDKNKAIDFYEKAIQESENNISSPLDIAEAYNYLGSIAENELKFRDASREYLTASTIAFSGGFLEEADSYRNKTSTSEIETSYSLIHAALVARMENNQKDVEFRTWESLRLLIKAYIHSRSVELYYLKDLTERILKYAGIILNSSIMDYKEILLKIEKTLFELQDQEIDQEYDELNLQALSELIEEQIPLPAPIFMLLTLDGRLIIMGEISSKGWQLPKIEGVLLSGILSAINSLISEVGSNDSILRTVDTSDFQILMEQNENFVCTLLVDRDNSILRSKLIELLNYIQDNYGEIIRTWDGKIDRFDNLILVLEEQLLPKNLVKLL